MNNLNIRLRLLSSHIINEVIYLYCLVFKKKYLILRWYEKKDGNFGDDLNIYLINRLLPHTIILKKVQGKLSKFSLLKSKPYLMLIGSILKNDIDNAIILGSGVMYENESFSGKPKKIHSVRGPLSAAKLLENGYQKTELFGDPALIISKIFPSSKVKKHIIGFVPHYVDKENPLSLRLIHDLGIHFIDIQAKPEKFIEELTSCEHIISSSLHGIIAADSYGIPCRWVKISSLVQGDGFKFRDYFKSVGKSNMNPFRIFKNVTRHDIQCLFDNVETIHFKIDDYYEFITKTLMNLNSTITNNKVKNKFK